MFLLILAQETCLLFQVPQHPSEFPHDTGIRAYLAGLLQHQGHVEHELIAVISSSISNADGVSDDTISVSAYRDQTVADLLAGDDEVGKLRKVNERCTLGTPTRRSGDDAAFGDLMDYSCA